MRVILSKNAKKQYDHLSPAEQKKLKKKLLSLEINPLGGKRLSGELSMYRSLRVWPYRIIYTINKKIRKKREQRSALSSTDRECINRFMNEPTS